MMLWSDFSGKAATFPICFQISNILFNTLHQTEPIYSVTAVTFKYSCVCLLFHWGIQQCYSAYRRGKMETLNGISSEVCEQVC